MELEIAGEKPGHTIEYAYRRKGAWDKIRHGKTAIDVVYLEDGMPYNGDTLALYDEVSNEWSQDTRPKSKAQELMEATGATYITAADVEAAEAVAQKAKNDPNPS